MNLSKLSKLNYNRNILCRSERYLEAEPKRKSNSRKSNRKDTSLHNKASIYLKLSTSCLSIFPINSDVNNYFTFIIKRVLIFKWRRTFWSANWIKEKFTWDTFGTHMIASSKAQCTNITTRIAAWLIIISSVSTLNWKTLLTYKEPIVWARGSTVIVKRGFIINNFCGLWASFLI